MVSDNVMRTSTANHGSKVLVSPEWLVDHLDDPSVVVVEVDVSAAAYERGHIPGTVLWNIYADLKDSNYDVVDQSSVEALVQGTGIAADSTVIVYGYGPAMGFWLLKRYGHADVRILDTSRDTWQAKGLPWDTAVPDRVRSSYALVANNDEIRASLALVKEAIEDPNYQILDVRSELEFTGERFWPSGGMEPGGRAGRVPSAVRVPADEFHNEDGSYKPSEELEAVFTSVNPDSELITYCTIGSRASTTWFVLTQLLGRDRVRVYDGSWTEWGRSADTPVEV